MGYGASDSLNGRNGVGMTGEYLSPWKTSWSFSPKEIGVFGPGVRNRKHGSRPGDLFVGPARKGGQGLARPRGSGDPLRIVTLLLLLLSGIMACSILLILLSR